MKVRDSVIAIIDYFYPPFKRFLPLQTFRYAVCGGGNVLLDILLFYISFNFILQKQPLNLGILTLKGYNGALLMAFCVTFPLGFLLSKYIVFQGSYLRGRIQLFRYGLIVAINLLLNYVLLNVMVQYLHFYPTLSKIFATAIIVTFSYLSQKHFTFRQSGSTSEATDN
ncbi:MAG: GtrA family protein [Chitinophagaceae bacterium]|nr:GtrA family protein [Chitinophagaceae bacterium]